MSKLLHCILTGYQFDSSFNIDETIGPYFSYEHIAVGKVKVGLSTLIELMNKRQYHNPVLAGICRNAFENKEEAPLITQNFIQVELKNYDYPKSFKEKCRHLLKFIYHNGGNDFKPFSLSSCKDYPLCYCDDHVEFNRIMNYLEESFFLKWKSEQISSGGVTQYYDVLLTDDGVEEVEKDLPKIPMIGLVDQKIKTGNSEVDEKINHAKELFFREPQTMEAMRSACENLCYVLEPFRKDLKTFFKAKDVNDFFQIVNTFDIRHNKDHLKDLLHPEQLEWVFYSLLNTINTYTKLKERLGLQASPTIMHIEESPQHPKPVTNT